VKTIICERGVRQGDSMTPTLFNIFRNDITDNFEDTLSTLLLFLSTLLLLSTKVGSLLFTDYLLIIYIF
jgi:hypothetical protein